MSEAWDAQQQKTDEELMIAYQMGDYAAFQALYRKHSAKVYGFLKRRLRRKEEADEVFQMVFSKLHNSRQTYDPSRPFVHWLFVVARSVYLDFYRKSKRQAEELVDFDLEEVADSADMAFAVEGPALLEIASLTTEQRQAVQWRVIDEISYEEIAAKLGRSQESVRQIISRALKKLKTKALMEERKP